MFYLVKSHLKTLIFFIDRRRFIDADTVIDFFFACQLRNKYHHWIGSLSKFLSHHFFFRKPRIGFGPLMHAHFQIEIKIWFEIKSNWNIYR